MDIKNDEKYIIKEGHYSYKLPQKPNPNDYHDILESKEERKERIYLYSEVK